MSELQDARELLREALRATGIRIAIVGTDLSFNEDKRPPRRGFTPFTTHMSAHFWALIPAKEYERGRLELRKALPRSDVVPRPVMGKRFDGDLAGLAYAFKTTFMRRQTLPKVVARDGATKKRRNSRSRPLTAAQKVQVMIALHEAGLRKRLF